MTAKVINHLFLTSRFLIKGRVRTGDQRLTNFLRAYRRPFLPLENFSICDLEVGGWEEAENGSVRLEEILLAHEYLGLSGDEHLRGLAEETLFDLQRVSFALSGSPSLEVEGLVRRDSVAHHDLSGFLVVKHPELRRVHEPRAEALQCLKNLPYLVLHCANIHGFWNHD
jgi:hypothetical protein